MEPKNTKKRMLKKCLVMSTIFVLSVVAISYKYNAQAKTHKHSYSAATCTSPARCSCGATKGSSLGHSYTSATCTSAAKCTRCGATKGSALGHSCTKATCTSASVCTRCGVTVAPKLGHCMSKATCTQPSKCTRSGCSYYQGTPLGHHIVDATCKECQHCDRCNASFGTTKGDHKYVVSADGRTKTCSTCGSTIVNTDYSIVKETATGIVDGKLGGINSKVNTAKDVGNLYESVKSGNGGDTIQNFSNVAGDIIGAGCGGYGEAIKETGTIAADAYNKTKAYNDYMNDIYSQLDAEARK